MKTLAPWLARLLLCGGLAGGAGLVQAAADRPVSLAGSWRFELDRADVGVTQRWFARPLTQPIRLPGALQNQGYGDAVAVETRWTGEVGPDRWLKNPEYAAYRQPGNIKIPWALQPLKHYVGPAWYQCDVRIPNEWRGQRVVLFLERPHWETRLWVDDRWVGTRASLSTPHVYDLGTRLEPGRHQVTLRVDNRLAVDVGSWAHSVTDHTQGNWNGLVGRIELQATPPVWIEDVQVHPNLAGKSVVVRGRVGNATGRSGQGQLRLEVEGPGARRPVRELTVRWDAAGGPFDAELPLGPDAALWDEFRPALHRLTARLEPSGHAREVSFGLREPGVREKALVLNGRNLFLRGTLECCIFPRTGYPPTDVEAWRRILRICQAHGLNHIRFHSWCPPEAAFVAADELGFYYQVECAAWARVGDGAPVDTWLYDEAAGIVRAYGNHPSFLLLAYGNEPSGPNHEAYLSRWLVHWRQEDPRRLHTAAAGWPILPGSQYHVTARGTRGPGGWPGADYASATRSLEAPVVVHEMGQWCVYPNFDELRKYTGPLQPRNLEIFRDSLAAHGMLDQWRDFLRASGRLQALCYKEEIEAAFRTPGISGVQLLDLHDFPGQGTALVGVLDAFWDSKGYISPRDYRRFFGPTVPLARLTRRTLTTADSLAVPVEIAHFGPAPIPGAAAVWRVLDERGREVQRGAFPARTIPVGQGTALGTLTIDGATLAAPAAYRLVVGLPKTDVENDWNLWVYPVGPPAAEPADVRVTSALDAAALAWLETGGKVLLTPTRLDPRHPKLTFEPVFWNKFMFHTQNRHTLGLLCQTQHPALADFPTRFHSDWQWHELVTTGRGVVLDELDPRLRPIVQVIDDWNSNRRLGLVFECLVGRGRLLVCAADLDRALDQRPAARQLRQSLLRYMAGKDFKPRVALRPEQVVALLVPARATPLSQLGARVVEVDSEDTAGENLAAHAIDGDPSTFWHTRWQPAPDPMPHHLVLDLGREVELRGLRYLPRQDMANGRLGRCEIQASPAADAWTAPAVPVDWAGSDQWQTHHFTPPLRGRYLKIVVRSEVHRHPFASAAEFDVLVAEP